MEPESREPQERPTPKPLDPPMVPFAVIGTALWAVATLVLLAMRHSLQAEGHGSWLPIAVAGFVWGFPGLAIMLVHDRNRRRRRARAAAPAQEV
jgi:hypothetical protein